MAEDQERSTDKVAWAEPTLWCSCPAAVPPLIMGDGKPAVETCPDCGRSRA
jgi:hypothetical protein